MSKYVCPKHPTIVLGGGIKCPYCHPRPADGELAERLHNAIYAGVKKLPSGHHKYNMTNGEIQELFRDCLTALQGVTISPECAEACLVAVEGVAIKANEFHFESTLTELKQALEHSNGR